MHGGRARLRVAVWLRRPFVGGVLLAVGKIATRGGRLRMFPLGSGNKQHSRRQANSRAKRQHAKGIDPEGAGMNGPDGESRRRTGPPHAKPSHRRERLTLDYIEYKFTLFCMINYIVCKITNKV